MADSDQEFRALRDVADSLPDPVLILDEEGRYVNVIGGSARSLYAGFHELIGKSLHDILPKDKADFQISVIRDAIQTRTLRTVEYRLSPDELRVGQGGLQMKEQWFEGRVCPIRSEISSRRFVVWVVINITAKKILETQLRKESETDYLTGTYNRRYFTDIFEREFRIAQRYRHSLSLLGLDLDYFKRINDTFGHRAGDVALQSFADSCKALLRNADVLARSGGEEFLILLPNTPREGALILADRIRQAVEEKGIPWEGAEPIRITVSIGVASVLESDSDAEEVIHRADKGLYSAKNSGRNQVVCLE